jgi:glycosyltransferase involved in cell wall biosynthesis
MKDNKVDISVIVTALNEEKNIAHVIDNTLKAFETFSLNGEIIVINDGSTDKTEEVVNNAVNKNARVRMLSHAHPEGVGASFWDGVDTAKGEIVTCLPGDNENDPWETMRYTGLLEHVDIVIPFIYNKWVRPVFRSILSFLYRYIINTTFGVTLNYTNGTVLYRKSILADLKYKSRGFFFQTDILVRLLKKGYLFAEVPYRLGLRKSGVSKAITFPSLVRVVKGYLRLVKGIYFSSGTKLNKKQFCDDSLSARRYNS